MNISDYVVLDKVDNVWYKEMYRILLYPEPDQPVCIALMVSKRKAEEVYKALVATLKRAR